ncbi:hypothetical protein L1987_74176 [Smallanthus sonchifolius]|uniref:Uncharacterized protein n=1 Tax=Smallanthus sonchifolius TaxID=185202 RepID=A0ACB9A6E5_9ASTR|nr:hypothetical protein L1987_74176 [Smallanthus sonchifolius]
MEGGLIIRDSLGRPGDTLEFTWEAQDVSAGLCLVLLGFGKRIEEEISVTWKNRSFVVWVREVEHQWPPELNWTQMPNREKELGDDGDRQMDIEEGEFRPVGASDSAVAMDTPTSPLLANQWEEETSPPGSHNYFHGNSKSAHVLADSRGSPGKGPSSMDAPNNLSREVDGDIRLNIPPFPDLNNLASLSTEYSGEDSSCDERQPIETSGAGTSSVIPDTQPPEALMAMEEEVADKIEIGKYLGIQIGDFADQSNAFVKGNPKWSLIMMLTLHSQIDYYVIPTLAATSIGTFVVVDADEFVDLPLIFEPESCEIVAKRWVFDIGSEIMMAKIWKFGIDQIWEVLENSSRCRCQLASIGEPEEVNSIGGGELAETPLLSSSGFIEPESCEIVAKRWVFEIGSEIVIRKYGSSE